MLQADPSLRPTAAEALRHEWFGNDRIIINELLNINHDISVSIVDTQKEQNTLVKKTAMTAQGELSNKMIIYKKVKDRQSRQITPSGLEIRNNSIQVIQALFPVEAFYNA